MPASAESPATSSQPPPFSLKPRLIVFDLDGTLVDSRRDLADAANAVLEECGGARLPEQAIGGMVGEGAATLVARAFAAAGVAQPPDALDRFLAFYNRHLLAHTRPYVGVPDLLARLQPLVPLALLTNKPLHATRDVLAGLDLARYFEPAAVLGGDGPFPRKPEPAGLQHLCDRVQVRPSDALLVGDSSIDVGTARRAGAQIGLVRYGFGFESVPPEEIASANYVIDAPMALIGVSRTDTLS